MISMQQALSGSGRTPHSTRTRSSTNSCDSYDGRLKKARASTLCKPNSPVSKPTCTDWRKCTQRQRNRRREKGAAPSRYSPDPNPHTQEVDRMIPKAEQHRTEELLDNILKFWRHIFGGQRDLLQIFTAKRGSDETID